MLFNMMCGCWLLVISLCLVVIFVLLFNVQVDEFEVISGDSLVVVSEQGEVLLQV